MFPPAASPERPYLRRRMHNGVRPQKQWCMETKKLGRLLPLLALLTACDDFGLPGRSDNGELRWTLDPSAFTKAVETMPDTNDFTLTVRDAGGTILYEGAYGDSPEKLDVAPGSYAVGVVSEPFTAPAFDKPQYGDEQIVVVGSGESVTVRLCCTLQNAGVRLQVGPEFLTSYPDGTLYVGQGKDKLLYKYKESRIAYLKPGSFSLLMQNYGEMQTLLTREIAAREVLTLKIGAPAPSDGSGQQIMVSVDTAKVWTSDQFVIGGGPSGGGGNRGEAPEDAISVGQAAAHAGEKGIWLYAYIVGGDLTSAGKTVKTAGITKDTHLAVADRSSVTAKESCVAVELPKGALRDALNLVDHPELIGTRIYLKGNVTESYFGTTGLKGTSDYVRK